MKVVAEGRRLADVCWEDDIGVKPTGASSSARNACEWVKAPSLVCVLVYLSDVEVIRGFGGDCECSGDGVDADEGENDSSQAEKVPWPVGLEHHHASDAGGGEFTGWSLGHSYVVPDLQFSSASSRQVQPCRVCS
jgi:hypothetical protein